MAKYGQASLAVRATLHRELVELVDETIKVMDHSLVAGARTSEMQRKMYADGRSQLPAGKSKHNVRGKTGRQFSEAFDSVPWDPEKGKQRWPNDSIWEALFGDGDGDWVFPEEDRVVLREFVLDVAAFYHLKGIERGIAHMKGIEIRQGRDWDGDDLMRDQSFHDVPHTELK